MPILAETHNGQLRIQGNETIQDAKDADAAKFRVGSRHVPGQSGGGGAYSFDVINEVSEGNHRTEVAVIVGGYNGKGGEVGVCVWDGVEPISDAGQPKVMEWRHDEIEFKVPIKAPNLGSANSRPSRFYTDGGKFCINWQDDTGQPSGVVYATHGSADESKWTAVGRLNMGPL